MFEAAIAWAKCDQTRIFGIGERDARLGDAFEPGGRPVTLEYGGGLDGCAISPASQHGGLAPSRAPAGRRGGKRGRAGPRHRRRGPPRRREAAWGPNGAARVAPATLFDLTYAAAWTAE